MSLIQPNEDCVVPCYNPSETSDFKENDNGQAQSEVEDSDKPKKNLRKRKVRNSQIQKDGKPTKTGKSIKASKSNMKAKPATKVSELQWNIEKVNMKNKVLSKMNEDEKADLKPGVFRHLIKKQMKMRFSRMTKKEEKAFLKLESTESFFKSTDTDNEFSLKHRQEPLINEKLRMRDFEIYEQLT